MRAKGIGPGPTGGGLRLRRGRGRARWRDSSARAGYDRRPGLPRLPGRVVRRRGSPHGSPSPLHAARVSLVAEAAPRPRAPRPSTRTTGTSCRATPTTGTRPPTRRGTSPARWPWTPTPSSRPRPGTGARRRRCGRRWRSWGSPSDTTVVLYGRFSFPDNARPLPGQQRRPPGRVPVRLHHAVGGREGRADAERRTPVVDRRRVRDHHRRDGARRPSTDFGADVPAAPGAGGGSPEAKEILASPDANLVSVRSWPEYIGEVSGYNYIEKKGRIPGSVFGDCGSDAYHMENYRNLDHTTREYQRGRGGVEAHRRHARQAQRLLLRDGLAGQRGVLQCLAPGMAPRLGVRRRMVRVEQRRSQPHRDGRSGWPDPRVSGTAKA